LLWTDLWTNSAFHKKAMRYQLVLEEALSTNQPSARVHMRSETP